MTFNILQWIFILFFFFSKYFLIAIKIVQIELFYNSQINRHNNSVIAIAFINDILENILFLLVFNFHQNGPLYRLFEHIQNSEAHIQILFNHKILIEL